MTSPEVIAFSWDTLPLLERIQNEVAKLKPVVLEDLPHLLKIGLVIRHKPLVDAFDRTWVSLLDLKESS